MNVLYLTYSFNVLLMIGFGIAAGLLVNRWFKPGWRLYWIGAATFVISQVFHLPFNFLVLNPFLKEQVLTRQNGTAALLAVALLGGLSAGLFEEFTRYGVLRWWARDARTWPQGLMFGAGHGGIEAIILGGLVLLTLVNMIVLQNTDLSTLVSPEQIESLQAAVSSYWSTPWYATLMGALERALTIPMHICFAVLVLQTFIRGRFRWVWLAVLGHTVMDAAVVFSAGTWGIYAAEAILAVMSVAGIIVIYALRGPGPATDNEADRLQDPVLPIQIKPAPVTEEQLESTRYERR